VDAARAGDVEAFEVLVRRYQLPMYRVALRILGSEADAEHAAREALVQAWRSLSTFRGESSFSTWLYRIVTNRSLTSSGARRVYGLSGRGVPVPRDRHRRALRRNAAAVFGWPDPCSLPRARQPSRLRPRPCTAPAMRVSAWTVRPCELRQARWASVSNGAIFVRFGLDAVDRANDLLAPGARPSQAC